MNKGLSENDFYIANQIILLAPKQIEFKIRDIALKILTNKLLTDLTKFENFILSTYTSDNYYDNIEEYLRDEKFINPKSLNTWTLSETGEKVKDLGGFLNYKKYLKRKLFWKTLENLPKKFWLPIAVLGYIMGLLTPTIRKSIEQKIETKSNQPDTPIQTKLDSLSHVLKH